jgi:hypothetical protein
MRTQQSPDEAGVLAPQLPHPRRYDLSQLQESALS